MQKIMWAIALLFVVGLAWRFRASITELATPTPPPKPIVFDNGTVRQYEPTPPPAASALPNGVLRKCVRGGETTYTNVSCPPGYEERPVDGSRMTVLPGAPAPSASGPIQAPANPRKTLRDALDLGSGDNLRDKAMERASLGESR